MNLFYINNIAMQGILCNLSSYIDILQNFASEIRDVSIFVRFQPFWRLLVMKGG